MSYKVFSIPPFDKQIKRLVKKYPSLKNEFEQLIDDLEKDPIKGDSLGKGCYKIRLAIKSKAKGKRGGARVIINVVISKEFVYLLTIYDKKDKDNISDDELKNLLSLIESDEDVED